MAETEMSVWAYAFSFFAFAIQMVAGDLHAEKPFHDGDVYWRRWENADIRAENISKAVALQAVETVAGVAASILLPGVGTAAMLGLNAQFQEGQGLTGYGVSAGYNTAGGWGGSLGVNFATDGGFTGAALSGGYNDRSDVQLRRQHALRLCSNSSKMRSWTRHPMTDTSGTTTAFPAGSRMRKKELKRYLLNWSKKLGNCIALRKRSLGEIVDLPCVNLSWQSNASGKAEQSRTFRDSACPAAQQRRL